jgi:hypothetical protein
MAKGTYTILDLATRSGIGVSSLIEGVLTFAPELKVVPAFPKAGITYTTLTRTALPNGDFRKVGAGVPLNKSEWKRETGSMMLFDAQMQINEDIVIAARSENPELETGDILTDEAIATLRGSVIRIGSQFWYGNKISTDGFAGLCTQVDTANNEIDAGGGAGNDTTSVYLTLLDDNPVNPEGVHFFVGNGGRFQMANEWIKQQIVDPNDATKRLMAYVNNFLSYLGLVVERPQAIYRIKNLDENTHGLTDKLAAQLWRKIPLALRQDKSKWRWWVGAGQLYMLQQSRSTTYVTGTSKGVGPAGVWPDMPEDILDVQIQPTDSLITTERNGLHQ